MLHPILTDVVLGPLAANKVKVPHVVHCCYQGLVGDFIRGQLLRGNNVQLQHLNNDSSESEGNCKFTCSSQIRSLRSLLSIGSGIRSNASFHGAKNVTSPPVAAK